MLRFVLILLLISNFAFSQQEVYAKAKEVCDCFYKLEKKDASKSYHIKVFNDCGGNEFQYADSVLVSELVFYCEAYNYYFEMYRFEEMIVKVAQNAQDKLEGKIIKLNDKLFKQAVNDYSLNQIQEYIPQLLEQFQMEKANELVELWIKQNPQDALPYFYRGYIYEYWRDYDFAISSFYQFKKLNKNSKLGNQLISFVKYLEEEEDEEEEKK
jgi:tetratricopeptide (TPR) repeat protein